jgi:hypothetical protein
MSPNPVVVRIKALETENKALGTENACLQEAAEINQQRIKILEAQLQASKEALEDTEARAAKALRSQLHLEREREREQERGRERGASGTGGDGRGGSRSLQTPSALQKTETSETSSPISSSGERDGLREAVLKTVLLSQKALRRLRLRLVLGTFKTNALSQTTSRNEQQRHSAEQTQRELIAAKSQVHVLSRNVEKLEKNLEALGNDYNQLSVVQGPSATSRTLHRLQMENRRLYHELEHLAQAQDASVPPIRQAEQEHEQARHSESIRNVQPKTETKRHMEQTSNDHLSDLSLSL